MVRLPQTRIRSRRIPAQAASSASGSAQSSPTIATTANKPKNELGEQEMQLIWMLQRERVEKMEAELLTQAEALKIAAERSQKRQSKLNEVLDELEQISVEKEVALAELARPYLYS